MLLQVLKSKLKKVIITASDKNYPGSITIDPDLMLVADMYPFERVEVNSVNGKVRIVTYVIEGKRGTGQVEMNGGAANFFKAGDEVHVNCFALAEKEDLINGKVIIVYTDKNNKVSKIEKKSYTGLD